MPYIKRDQRLNDPGGKKVSRRFRAFLDQFKKAKG